MLPSDTTRALHDLVLKARQDLKEAKSSTRKSAVKESFGGIVLENAGTLLAALSMLVGVQEKKERAAKLAPFGLDAKEARKYKTGFIVCMDSAVFRDEPGDVNEGTDPPLIEHFQYEAKRMWLQEAIDLIGGKTWQIVDLSIGDVVESGNVSEYFG